MTPHAGSSANAPQALLQGGQGPAGSETWSLPELTAPLALANLLKGCGHPAGPLHLPKDTGDDTFQAKGLGHTRQTPWSAQAPIMAPCLNDRGREWDILQSSAVQSVPLDVTGG